VRVLVVGDSTAEATTEGIAAWALAHPGYLEISTRWCPGCGFLLDGTITSWDAAAFVKQSADVLQHQLPEAVRQLRPDLVVLMSTVNDVANRRWTAAEGVLTPEDAAYRARLDAAYRGATDFVRALGVANVAWIMPPTPFPPWPEPEMRDPVRWQVHHDVIRSAVAARPSGVSLIDLDGWMAAIGEATDVAWRPDGVHLTRAAATTAADRFLGPAMVRIALGQSLG
jgi:lysophospholipase L1-like esterase